MNIIVPAIVFILLCSCALQQADDKGVQRGAIVLNIDEPFVDGLAEVLEKDIKNLVKNSLGHNTTILFVTDLNKSPLFKRKGTVVCRVSVDKINAHFAVFDVVYTYASLGGVR